MKIWPLDVHPCTEYSVGAFMPEVTKIFAQNICSVTRTQYYCFKSMSYKKLHFTFLTQLAC